ncbi:MAG: Magnesium transporter MgtE [Verrucomicrobia subdivision 3 bacterium]|nr:Magnesium transporter MgtE [Limisphaerales bacterium]MCS1413451.1 Magnesium transporter MgtE [Limisphaerales bacterium]
MPDLTPDRLAAYSQLHPADLADALERFDDPKEAIQIIRHISDDLAAASFAELDTEVIQELSPLLTEEELAGLLERLPHSETTDIVGELPLERQQEVLDELPLHVASPVRTLLQYPENTAGGIMSDQYTALNASGTIADALNQLRQDQRAAKEISYLYVTDDQSRLVGVASFRDLVLSPQNEPIRNITKPDVMRLKVTDDQEEIARQFEHYHFLGLPVVDESDRLIGVVEANEAIQIAQEEATEDMQLMVGVSGEERALTPWHRAIGKRLPWLYVNLLTAFAAAAVVSLYESTIAQWTVLAVFLPIVAGQGGNAGMQTLTVIIRDLALGEINPGDGRRAILKEIYLGLVNGVAIGLVVGLVGFLWKGSAVLGLIVGIAMILNQLTAVLAGVMIPLTLKWLRIDPALASSIFLTTLTDIGGFFFFLWLATYALQR